MTTLTRTLKKGHPDYRRSEKLTPEPEQGREYTLVPKFGITIAPLARYYRKRGKDGRIKF